MSSKPRIAVLYGGISNEREVSLKSGQQIALHVNQEKYAVQLVEITAQGQWLLPNSGVLPAAHAEDAKLIPFETLTKRDAKLPFELVFIALHGKFGEDGRVQSLLELLGLPYTGSGVMASAVCMNKALSNQIIKGAGLAVPEFFLVHTKNLDIPAINQQIQNQFKYPCIVKPNESGSSVGVSLVKNEDELKAALEAAGKEDQSILVQQYIKGREVTCGVLGNASTGGTCEALPPVEILSDAVFFDYQSKYISSATKELCPAPLTEQETKELQTLATKAHQLFTCDGLTRSDFILCDGTFYYLETNTLPGLTAQSLCPKEAVAAGMGFEGLLERIIAHAMEKGS